ncbi:sulfotransferase family protein [Streptomyces sp. NPDC057705]|uniref:sulfotransferase family protein n=1 Tax=Streptomyces sp. NPDC057705 TaxID=3346222 RepID=UPI003698CF24
MSSTQAGREAGVQWAGPQAVAWAVIGRVALPAGRARPAARALHHAPFPGAAGLLARGVRTDAHGVRARYLFATAAAAAFRATQDPSLSRLGPPVTGPVRPVPAAAAPDVGSGPVIIVSPPRSGSTALFDALARHPGLWTVGGESESVIEGVPALHPAADGYASHALGAEHADRHGSAVRAGFLAELRDARGLSWLDCGGPQVPPPRLLEKTPENCLRLPFLLRTFPDATVVHLHRDARDTVASMVRAWTHPAFVNIPDLPGWPRRAWHLLLPAGWRRWRDEDLSRIAARQWAAAVDAVLDCRASRTAGRWVDVDYAALSRAPARTIRWLERELGLPAGPPGRDLPLSPTTITPPRPGKWRRTPGFDPTALDSVTRTRRRLTNGRTPMPQTTHDPRRCPSFVCWLDDPGAAEPAPVPRPGPGPDPVLDPAVVLQEGVTIPLGLVRRARFRDRFLPDRPILWTDDPATGALAPFWVSFEDFWTLRTLVPGGPLPAALSPRLYTALARADALGSAEQRARTAALADAVVAAAAADFERTDVCRIDRMVHPRHREALLDYYEKLIATGSWPLGDAQVTGRYGWQNESLSRFFHHQFRTLVGRIAGRPVRPSYSYVSAYRGGAVLDRHVDREQCEYTVSLLLGESGPGIDGGWPLHLGTSRGEVSLVQRPGQAVLFRGTRVPHGRPPLPDGSAHTSLLFHYVPAEFRRTLY